MKTVGIIGTGFVGTALHEGMKHACHIETYDLQKASTCDTVQQLCERSDFVFVCVPTPMQPSGESSTRIVGQVMKDIADACRNIPVDPPTIVIKSTVPPGTTKLYDEFMKALFDVHGLEEAPRVLFNPEFLTEANYINDFKNQDRIIIGGENEDAIARLAGLYEESYPGVPQVHLPSAAAEMVKYTTNVFLATKVSLANELAQVCDKLNVDYDTMIAAAQLDKRLGTSHWMVPGPMPLNDGSGNPAYGFGGSCFVKDINALMYVARELGVDPKVMKGAWDKNLEVRPCKDWEHLKGRAVTDVKE